MKKKTEYTFKNKEMKKNYVQYKQIKEEVRENYIQMCTNVSIIL